MSAQSVSFIPPPPYTPEPPYLPPGGIPMTVEEYHEFNRKSEIRYEYVGWYAIPKEGVEELPDGTIRAMSGVSPRHNRAAGNVYNHIDRAFGDRECDVYMADIRVRVTPGQYRYPDVVALCGDAQFDSGNPPCLLNPSVIVEVLSPSTEAIDRGQKFLEYRDLLSVTDYVLITQDQILVEHFARQNVATWTFTQYTALSDTLTFASIDVSITLADIYRKIVVTSAALPAAP